MKKIFLFCAGAAISLFFGLSFSCSERLQNSDMRTSSECSDFTLDEVKRAFESDYAAVLSTRTDESFDENVVLAPGRIVPVWDAVSYCYGDSDSSFLQADVPFAGRYDYYLLRWNEEGRSEFASMPSRLIVLKNSDTGATASWLFFWISDAGCYLSGDSAVISGLALYTTLEGFPVCAAKYENGVFVGSASLMDDSRTLEENVEKLVTLLPVDVFVARIRPKVVTRWSDIYTSIDIDAVEIVGQAPIKIPEPVENRDPSPLDDECRLPVFVIDGSGSGASDIRQYSKNPKIRANKELIELLEALYEDCMGKRLINSITVEVNIEFTGMKGSHSTIYATEDGQVVSSKITMGYPMNTWVLMEELTHIYQYIHGSNRNNLLNMEIEAKLGWYTYLKRVEISMDPRKALGGTKGEIYFNCMWEYLLKGDLKNLEFLDAFDGAADALRNIKAYSDPQEYRYDPNKKDCANLLELLEDCEYK